MCIRPVVTQEEGTNGYLLRPDTSYPRSHLSHPDYKLTQRATTRDVRFGIFIFMLSFTEITKPGVFRFLDEKMQFGAANSGYGCKNAAGISGRLRMNRRLIRNALDTVT